MFCIDVLNCNYDLYEKYANEKLSYEVSVQSM